ncbi:hypothetical protein MY4824_009831 [Beauveria thailandica]
MKWDALKKVQGRIADRGSRLWMKILTNQMNGEIHRSLITRRKVTGPSNTKLSPRNNTYGFSGPCPSPVHYAQSQPQKGHAEDRFHGQ